MAKYGTSVMIAADMGRNPDEHDVTAPLSKADFAAFERLRKRGLENMSARRLGRILLHHAIWHPEEAFALRLREALEAKEDDEPEGD